MQQDIDEKLSMLMDDELGVDEALDLLDQIEQDEELQQKWSRYCSAREAIHGSSLVLGPDDLASRVSQALKDEPVVLAPRSKSSRRKPKTAVNMGWRSGFALAASVALVAIVIGYQHQTAPRLPANQFDALAENQSQSSETPAANLAVSQIAPAELATVSQDARFTDYLATHNEIDYSVGGGTQGILPYARYVNYQVEQ